MASSLCVQYREWKAADQNGRAATAWNLFAQDLIDHIVVKVPQYKVRMAALSIVSFLVSDCVHVYCLGPFLCGGRRGGRVRVSVHDSLSKAGSVKISIALSCIFCGTGGAALSPG
jgi:hypothetical protein